MRSLKPSEIRVVRSDSVSGCAAYLADHHEASEASRSASAARARLALYLAPEPARFLPARLGLLDFAQVVEDLRERCAAEAHGDRAHETAALGAEIGGRLVLSFHIESSRRPSPFGRTWIMLSIWASSPETVTAALAGTFC